MMDESLISGNYAALNAELHERSDGYGSSAGKRWAGTVDALIEQYGCKSVIDYGCGKGTLKPALQDLRSGLTIREYDPAISARSRVPRAPADMVVCLDVLEHVEEEKVPAVIEHLASLTKEVLFATVCTRPASEHKLLADGTNPHATIKPLSWWVRRLEKRFDVVSWDGVGDHEYKLIATRLR